MKTAAEEFATDILKKYRNSSYRNRTASKNLSSFLLEGNPVGRKILFNQARKRTLKTTRGHYPAPLKALESVERGFPLPLKDALEIEAGLVGELIASKESKNLISVYYLNESAKKDLGVEKNKHQPAVVNQVGLLGAGVMGGGIAQLLAYNEIPVRMKDIAEEALDLGLKNARRVFQQAVDRKKLKPREMERKMSLIESSLDFTGFSKVDFVIEAIVENLSIKQKIFAEVEGKVSDETVIATNTSSLSVTEIAKGVKKPERVIGFHFFNPVHRMPLVEIIRGDKTSDQTTLTAVAFAKRLDKTPIVVKNSPGFLVNRILGPYINEATLILEEGASIEKIDRAMLDFGMPMGPLNLMDEVGIDVGHKVSHILAEAFGDRVVPSKIIERLNEDGRLGKKGGKGFYIYEGKKKSVDPTVYSLISDLRGEDGKISKEDIQNRLVFMMIKEATLCLQEKVVRKAQDVDIGMIFGTGFPPFRGGLLKYADNLGIKPCVAALKVLENTQGKRFSVPKLLSEMAEEGKLFYEN